MEDKNSAKMASDKYALSKRELEYFVKSVKNAEEIADRAGYDTASPQGLAVVCTLIPIVARHRFYLGTMFAQEDAEKNVKYSTADGIVIR